MENQPGNFTRQFDRCKAWLDISENGRKPRVSGHRQLTFKKAPDSRHPAT